MIARQQHASLHRGAERRTMILVPATRDEAISIGGFSNEIALWRSSETGTPAAPPAAGAVSTT
jgi:hypothetical protein